MQTATKPAKRQISESQLMAGSEILIQALLKEGVDTIFGYPGGVLLNAHDVLYKIPQIRHILVRHEQGATHAADGYARATGKPGVVLVTSGPGATNTVTGITTAYMDSVPLVVLTGQVPSHLIGNDAFQEADIIGMTRPITKHSYLVRDANRLQDVIRKAFHIASTGRPGPVLVDLPKDILALPGIYQRDVSVSLRGYQPVYEGYSPQIEKAAQAINEAERPLIYAGGGVVSGDAADILTRLARKGSVPVTTTLMGLGCFPEDDALSLGMVGMHGTWAANAAIMECDVLVAVGARFDDRVTGKLESFSPSSKKIHIDIDPSCISKNVRVDVPIVGHVRQVLNELVQHIKKRDRSVWLRSIEQWKNRHPLRYAWPDDRLAAPYVIQRVAEATDHDAIVVTDVGQNQMWAAQFYGYRKSRSFLSSGGLGTMGYGLPAAVGAALARPDQTVVCFTGDGGYQMNVQELATAVHYKLPIKIALLNNGYLGMVRQWQDLFFDKRYANTDIEPGNPDFIQLSESFGARAFRVSTKDQVDEAIKESLQIHDRPVVMEFLISREQNVMPMVPAGASLMDMLEEPEHKSSDAGGDA